MDMPQLVILSLRTLLTLGSSGLYNHWKQSAQKNEAPIQKHLLGFNSDGQYLSSDYNTIHHLIYHLDSLLIGELKRYCLDAIILADLLDQFTAFFQVNADVARDELKDYGTSLLFLHIMNLPFNAHAINEFHLPPNPDPEDIRSAVAKDIGAGAFSLLSMFNHSCDANVTRVTLPHGVTAIVTIRSLKKGEQLLDNYGAHYAMQSKAMRQKHLKKHYSFTCLCIACKHEWPAIDEGLMDSSTRFACAKCMKNVPFHDKLKSQYRKCVFIGNNWCCEKCSAQCEKKAIQEEMQEYEEKCSSGYDLVLNNKPLESIPVLVDVTQFFENNAIPPVFTLNIAQESLKQAFNLLTIGME